MFLDLAVGSLTEPAGHRHWNREEVPRRIAARIRHYQSAGLSVGDRVFIHYGNRMEFFADLLAIWHLGGCAVPIDSRLTNFEVENLARLVVPRLSIADDKTDSSAVSLMGSLGTKVISTLEADTDESGGPVPPSRARLDADALVLFTSGSTGAPKGVVHTHRSLRARWIALRDHLGLEPYERTLCLLPTHFGHGLICNSLFPWLSGQDLFIAPPFNTEVMMRLGALINDHKITMLSSVPSLWGLVLKVAKPPEPGTLRRVHCGSAPLSAHLWQEIERWASTRVLNTYGITETGSWVAGTTLGDFVPSDGLIGKPWGAVIRVLKTSDDLGFPDQNAVCRPGEAGHIWINTAALMKGYFNQDELTGRVVKGGWFLTGDIGLLDEREVLYQKSREGEEINRGGTKIYPADVDSVVQRFEQTIDAVTFGVEDPLYGQDVAIAISLREVDHRTIRSLYRWLKLHLAEHKIPRRWYLLAAIPRTSRGKVNRSDLMKQCSSLKPLELQKILSSEESAL
jgi:acyl-CoA synthetase (AMP-forming)/AMP-acid ligase II